MWDRTTCDQYETNIALLGLKANTSKSYRSRTHGVFCERLVRRTGKNRCKAKACIRIGEAAGSRAIDGKKGLTVVDNLANVGQRPSHHEKVHPVLRRLAVRIAKQQAISLTAPGKISLGGGGVGVVDGVGLVAFAMNGPVPLTSVDDKLNISDLRSLLRDVPPHPNGVRASELLVAAKTAIEQEHRLAKGMPTQKPDLLKRKALKRRLHDNRKKAKAFIKLHGGILGALRYIDKNRPYFFSNRRMLNSALHKVRAKNYQRAAEVLQRSWNRTIDSTIASRAFHASVPGYEPRLSLETLEPIPEEWDSRTISE